MGNNHVSSLDPFTSFISILLPPSPVFPAKIGATPNLTWKQGTRASWRRCDWCPPSLEGTNVTSASDHNQDDELPIVSIRRSLHSPTSPANLETPLGTTQKAWSRNPTNWNTTPLSNLSEIYSEPDPWADSPSNPMVTGPSDGEGQHHQPQLREIQDLKGITSLVILWHSQLKGPNQNKRIIRQFWKKLPFVWFPWSLNCFKLVVDSTHLKNMNVKWDHFPTVWGENEKYLKPSPSVSSSFRQVTWGLEQQQIQDFSLVHMTDLTSLQLVMIQRSVFGQCCSWWWRWKD